jgi:hypothetical protein
MLLSSNIKTRRQLISFVYHLAVWTISLLGISVGINLMFYLLAFHLFTFRLIPIVRWLQEQLIPEAVCLACGQEIELVNQYRCGCGYISPRERHIFSPCALCGQSFLWIVCPACETSILI